MEQNRVVCENFRRKARSRLCNDSVLLCVLPPDRTVWLKKGGPGLTSDSTHMFYAS